MNPIRLGKASGTPRSVSRGAGATTALPLPACEAMATPWVLAKDSGQDGTPNTYRAGDPRAPKP
mgnify:FL=1